MILTPRAKKSYIIPPNIVNCKERSLVHFMRLKLPFFGEMGNSLTAISKRVMGHPRLSMFEGEISSLVNSKYSLFT